MYGAHTGRTVLRSFAARLSPAALTVIPVFAIDVGCCANDETSVGSTLAAQALDNQRRPFCT
ncbi:hypothetical protein WL06_23995 [Burkholderia cepacia]|nr:hypothetical protein WL06_23995 [Burkholderia cepacia]